MRSQAVSTPSRQAWVALYDSGLGDVYGYLLHRCGDPVLSQDLTSETFLAVARAASGDHPVEPTMPWLMTIARHKLIDHWRHATIEEKSLQLIAGGSESTDERWTVEIDEGPALRVLHQMSPQHRSALTLRYLDGLSVAETAKVLERTFQATETLIARAKAQFRRMYDEAMKEGRDV
jgi:RNA polymerase sigma-70 factor, ECF subfamily